MTITYQKLKTDLERKNKSHEFDKYLTNLKGVVMRQTNYDEETAKEKLIEHDLDVMKIIREYMNVSNTNMNTDNKVKSTNQKMYGEFRKFLDDASSKHYKRKEFEELQQRYIQQQLINRHNLTNNNVIITSTIDSSNNVVI